MPCPYSLRPNHSTNFYMLFTFKPLIRWTFIYPGITITCMKISFARQFGFALFVLLGFIAATTLRADWTLGGRITDNKGFPLPGVVLEIKGPQGSHKTEADSHGYYHFGGLIVGEQHLILRMDGYATLDYYCPQPYDADGHRNFMMYEGDVIPVRLLICGGAIDTHSSAVIIHIPQWVMELER